MAKIPNSMVKEVSKLSKVVIDYLRPFEQEIEVTFIVTLLSDNTARGHFTVIHYAIEALPASMSGDSTIRKFRTVQNMLDFEKDLLSQGFQRINITPRTSRGSLTQIK
jgi:hypothetical protein